MDIEVKVTDAPLARYNLPLTLVAITVATVLGTAMYAYLQEPRIPTAKHFDIRGRAYLSLVPLEAGTSTQTGIYEYDLHTRKIYKTLVDENANMTPSYREDEPQVLFSSRTAGGEFQIELYDERVKLPPFPVTNSTSSEKRFPVWSPDRRSFAFTAHEAGGRALTPNDWSVYVYSFRSREHEESSPIEETRVASGYSPTFSPSGSHVIYLRNDGIYAQPSGGGAEFRLARNPADLSSRFSISSDGTLLVWTRPAEKVAEIYTIANPLSLTLKSTLDITLADPYFAGNNTHLIGVAESTAYPGTLSLIAYNLRNEKQTELLTLRLFDRNQIFVSDVRH